VTASQLSLLLNTADAFSLVGVSNMGSSSSALSSSSTEIDAAFSAFADSLEEDDIFNDDDDDFNSSMSTWQESLDALLNPLTPPGKKQIFFSDLVSANEEIRQSLETAVRQRTLDPILTPTTRKLQDGTRAVARQITTDILPSLADGTTGGINTGVTPPTLEELPTLVPKIGSRILDAISTQAKRQVEMIQEDLADPATRIPQRISKQTADFAQEARNVFRETPEGLLAPKYSVVNRNTNYEIRDYEAYSAASTFMSKIGEPYSVNDMASSGTAFQTLAAYIFGANEEQQTLDMTTPVVTTSAGEMRFYLETTSTTSPTPLESGEFYERGAVKVMKVCKQRLAVARFTGFVTEGEVARQKDALLNRLKNDGVELDVPHGAVVPHKIFQYNPPYTIPIVRRNEIAVPVRRMDDFNDDTNNSNIVENTEDNKNMPLLKKEWEVEDDDTDLVPSDVE